MQRERTPYGVKSKTKTKKLECDRNSFIQK